MGKSTKTQSNTDSGASAMTAGMMAINPVATTAWLDIMNESARFISNRLQQDLKTQQAMLAVKSPEELLQLQSEFLQTAMEQYTDEATRLYQMMSKSTEDTIKDALTGHTRNYDDVPL